MVMPIDNLSITRQLLLILSKRLAFIPSHNIVVIVV
jgi:hypothetical protein